MSTTTTTIENKSLTTGHSRRNQPRQALHHPLTSVIGLAILLHSLLDGQNTWKRLKLATSKLATMLCRTPRRCSSPPSPPYRPPFWKCKMMGTYEKSRPPFWKFKLLAHMKNHVHLYENIHTMMGTYMKKIISIYMMVYNDGHIWKDSAHNYKKHEKWANIKNPAYHVEPVTIGNHSGTSSGKTQSGEFAPSASLWIVFLHRREVPGRSIIDNCSWLIMQKTCWKCCRSRLSHRFHRSRLPALESPFCWGFLEWRWTFLSLGPRPRRGSFRE